MYISPWKKHTLLQEDCRISSKYIVPQNIMKFWKECGQQLVGVGTHPLRSRALPRSQPQDTECKIGTLRPVALPLVFCASVCVCVCMFVCVYMCMYIYIYTCNVKSELFDSWHFHQYCASVCACVSRGCWKKIQDSLPQMQMTVHANLRIPKVTVQEIVAGRLNIQNQFMWKYICRLFRSFCDGLRSIWKGFLFLFERIPKCFFIGESTRKEVGARALSLSSNLCMHLRMHRSRCLCIYVCIRIYTLTYGTDHLRNSRNQACLARVTVEW